jgi:erythromycin esterase
LKNEQLSGNKPAKSKIDWLKANLIDVKTVEAGNGFDDLKQLENIIGDAKIVSLGEATHGTREIFQISTGFWSTLLLKRASIFFINKTNSSVLFKKEQLAQNS